MLKCVVIVYGSMFLTVLNKQNTNLFISSWIIIDWKLLYQNLSFCFKAKLTE